jgi:hypothetical protein
MNGTATGENVIAADQAYDLRHAARTFCERRTEGRQRAARHSKIGITPDLYSHVMPGMQADASRVDDALQAALQ